MKRILLTFLTLLFTSFLFAFTPTYQMFPAAMNYNMGLTKNPNTTGWVSGTSTSGGGYVDADMITKIAGNSDNGFYVKIESTLIFTTTDDMVVQRPYGIELVARKNDSDILSESKTGAYVISSIPSGNDSYTVDNSWKNYNGRGIYPVLTKEQSNNMCFYMPKGDVWIDFVIVLPEVDDDSLAYANNYVGSATVTIYNKDGSVDLNNPDEEFTVFLTGFYNGKESVSDNTFQFIVTPDSKNLDFDFDDANNWGRDVTVGTVNFSTNTKSSDAWGEDLPSNYYITIGASSDYTASNDFLFRLVGTEGREATSSNSLKYTVSLNAIAPTINVPLTYIYKAGSWFYPASITTDSYTKSVTNLSGGEVYSYRRVQVPCYKVSGDFYGALYAGRLSIKMEDNGAYDKLYSGLYRTTIYVHVLSGT